MNTLSANRKMVNKKTICGQRSLFADFTMAWRCFIGQLPWSPTWGLYTGRWVIEYGENP